MTFIYELAPYPVKMHRQTKNELSTSRQLKVIIALHTMIQTYIQMPPKTVNEPICEWQAMIIGRAGHMYTTSHRRTGRSNGRGVVVDDRKVEW